MNRRATPYLLSICLVGLFVLGAALPLQANTADNIYEFRPGVTTSRQYPFSNRQLQTLLDGLRFCTGFTEIKFDESGRINLGSRTLVRGGSAKARDLLIAAVDNSDSFILENHYRSATVAFAQIADTDNYVDGDGKKHWVWQLRLDFFDFSLLRGGRLSLATFDPTFNLLHELIHGVLKLNDPLNASDSLGDCERHLNLIRAELELPERQSYLPRQRLVSTIESDSQVLQAELNFVQKDPRTEKTKDLYITFDMRRVCDLAKSQLAPDFRRQFPLK